MQGYHTCTLFFFKLLLFLNYGISAHANVYMQPLKCRNSDIFACHTENHAYGFLAGVRLQRAVSPLCLWANFNRGQR